MEMVAEDAYIEIAGKKIATCSAQLATFPLGEKERT
jgi:hypothetical protein